MGRPLASNGDSLTDNAWGIYDAGAFHINDATKWHLLASFPTGVTVRGKCGVMAYSLDYSLDYEHITRRASWANGFDGTQCQTCKGA